MTSWCYLYFLFWRWLFLLQILLGRISGVHASFNLFVDRAEVSNLLGLNSDIYLVREGVVNEYALNFVVPVPPNVERLQFSWQALTKRPVHYEMVIEYKDFFALDPAESSISNKGRVPQKLESFRVNLPCSGRTSSEVEVHIRFTFHVNVKHSKHNVTHVNVRRNKICHQKKLVLGGGESLPASETTTPGRSNAMTNSTLLFQDPAPSLLLAGLLGGCAVTASTVFLTFFICLRRKLVPSSSSSSPTNPTFATGLGNGSDPNSSSNNSSPACLLRQIQADSKWITTPNGKDKFSNPNSTILSRSASRNSYVTIASFWNDIFATGTNTATTVGHPPSLTNNCHRISASKTSTANNSHNSSNTQPNSTFKAPTRATSTKGSDVSPYAYAHIIPPPLPPPLPLLSSSVVVPIPISSPKLGHSQQPPPLIEWYSQSPVTASAAHIYSNHLYTFSQNPMPKPKSCPSPKNPPETVSNDGNSSTTGRSGSESLVQIDGFQCRKNYSKETNVIERFL